MMLRAAKTLLFGSTSHGSGKEDTFALLLSFEGRRWTGESAFVSHPNIDQHFHHAVNTLGDTNRPRLYFSKSADTRFHSRFDDTGAGCASLSAIKCKQLPECHVCRRRQEGFRIMVTPKVLILSARFACVEERRYQLPGECKSIHLDHRAPPY